MEHSEREPELVFVKSLREESAQSNLLISTTRERQISFLLVNHREAAASKVDFLFRYQASSGFLIEPNAVPLALISQGTHLPSSRNLTTAKSDPTDGLSVRDRPGGQALDSLLERQKEAPLPRLYDKQIENEEFKNDLLRAGISEVIDDGQQVVVLFAVVNTSKRSILLMPPSWFCP